MKQATILLLALVWLQACKKDADDTIPQVDGVYTVDEGLFNFGNADISFYNPETNEVTTGLFRKANGYYLGDVAQCLYVKDTLGFIVVNNSQKIELVSIPSFKSIRTISIPGSSPRYIQPINNHIAYVTELYAKKIHVIDYQTGTVLQQIASPTDWTEHIIQMGDNILIEGKELDASTTNNAGLVVLNTNSNSIINNIKLNAANTNGIVIDKYSRIWVAKSASTAYSLAAKFYCLDASYSVVDSIVFSNGDKPNTITINKAGDRIYYLTDEGVKAVSIEDKAPTLLIPSNNRYFYGLSIDPKEEDIYVADVIDFVQPARTYRYSKDGTEKQSFTTGTGTNNFVFSYE
jgi:hypothetical protein